MEKNNLKLYLWRYQDKYTIFALAANLEDARTIAVKKAGAEQKESVLRVVEDVKPNVYDEPDSFIFQVGAQLI